MKPIRLRPEDLAQSITGVPGGTSEPGLIDQANNFMNRLDQTLGNITNLVKRFADLPNNPDLKSLLGGRLAKYSPANSPQLNPGADPSKSPALTADQIYNLIVKGLGNLSPVMGKRTLNELIEYIQANPDTVIRGVKDELARLNR